MLEKYLNKIEFTSHADFKENSLMVRLNIISVMFAIGLAVLMILTVPAANVSAAPREADVEAVFGATKYTLNGKSLKQDTLVCNGVAYLPAAYFVRELGLDARWDPDTNSTYITYAFGSINKPDAGTVSDAPVTKRINVTFGAPTYYLNGKELEEESLTYNGTAYLPAGYFAEALGVNAKWDSDTNITSVSFTHVERISFDEIEIGLDVNKTLKLNPKVTPDDATFKTLRYITSNDKVVVVDQQGKIQTKSEGTAIITCTAVNGIYERVRIIVKKVIAAESISVSFDKERYIIDDTAKFTVKVLPENVTDKNYTVSIDNESLAKIKGNSMQCLRGGQLTVTVTASNGVSSSVKIEIIDLNDYASELVQLINEERIKYGVHPLSSNSYLEVAATRMLKEGSMFTYSAKPTNEKSIKSNGDCEPPKSTNVFITYYPSSEIIATGYTSAADLMKDLLDDENTQALIMCTSRSAVGVWVDMDDYGTLYWCIWETLVNAN